MGDIGEMGFEEEVVDGGGLGLVSDPESGMVSLDGLEVQSEGTVS